MSIELISWLNIYFQLIILLFLLYKFFFNENFIGSLYFSVFIILVIFQEIWLLQKFETWSTSHLLLLGHEITKLSFYYATLCVTIFVCVQFLLYKIKPPQKNNNFVKPEFVPTQILFTYRYIYFVYFITLLVFLNKYGGFLSMINSPGQNLDPGLTMFLLTLGIGRFPLYTSLLNNQKLKLIEYLIFLNTFLIYLLNSRFLTIFIIMELFLILISIKKISKLMFLNVIVLSGLVIVFFGLYRNMTNYNINNLSYIEYLYWYIFSGQIFDWLYYGNIEAFTGLAGIIAFDLKYGIFYDFGLSHFSFLFKLVPFFIRQHVYEYMNYLYFLYPYNGSLISSGLENAYAAFSYTGIFIYSLLIYFIIYFSNNFLGVNKIYPLFNYVIPVALIHLLRGLIGGTVLLAIANSLIICLFYFLLKSRHGDYE